MTTEDEPLADVDLFGVQIPGRLLAVEMLLIQLLRTTPIDTRRAVLDATQDILTQMESETFGGDQHAAITTQKWLVVARMNLDHIGGLALDAP